MPAAAEHHDGTGRAAGGVDQLLQALLQVGSGRAAAGHGRCGEQADQRETGGEDDRRAQRAGAAGTA
ncbi:hypothetical protein KNE206_00400 [Kitasatospora sp. NE20-6]